MGVHRNDILWGSALEDFFIEFLRFFFIEADNIFDFSKRFVFFDRALPEIFLVDDVKHPKIVDKLVRVHLKNGKTRWFLIHVEVQGYSQAIFTRRMFTYYYRILEKYNMPVTSMVIYLGKRNKSNASFYNSDFLGTKIRFDFNTFYVGEQKEDELRKSENPFAVIVLTALLALKHKNNIQKLFDHKIALIRNLLQAGFNKKYTRKLLNFVRLYIDFEKNEQSANFENEIKLLTNKKPGTMGILEQVRELLKERERREGERKGELQAKTSIAKKLKSSGVSLALITKCTGLSLKQVKMLK